MSLANGRCDRCGCPIRDFRPPMAGGMTAGYYHNWYGVEVCCDYCMWASPQYVAEYGCNIPPGVSMSWGISSAGHGADVVVEIRRQVKGTVESTYQTEASKAQVQAAGELLCVFASQFPDRLISVSANGHADTSYGSCQVQMSTLTEAPKAS